MLVVQTLSLEHALEGIPLSSKIAIAKIIAQECRCLGCATRPNAQILERKAAVQGQQCPACMVLYAWLQGTWEQRRG